MIWLVIEIADVESKTRCELDAEQDIYETATMVVADAFCDCQHGEVLALEDRNLLMEQPGRRC